MGKTKQQNLHNPDNTVTINAACWLLFFVFFLQLFINFFLNGNQYVVISVTEFAALFLPCVVFLYLNYIDIEAVPKIFSLNTISFKDIILCIFIGITAQFAISLINVPVNWIISYKFSILFEDSISTPISFYELIISVFTVALIPAICEEALMRGIVLSATKPFGYRASLLINGLFFAILHTQPENFLGHFALGVLLCYIVWTTNSLLAGIIVHFSVNAFGMLYYYLIDINSVRFPWLNGGYFTWSVVFASVALFLLLLNIINKKDGMKRYKSVNFGRNLLRSFINIPILITLAGYIIIQYIRFT